MRSKSLTEKILDEIKDKITKEFDITINDKILKKIIYLQSLYFADKLAKGEPFSIPSIGCFRSKNRCNRLKKDNANNKKRVINGTKKENLKRHIVINKHNGRFVVSPIENPDDIQCQ